MFCFCSVIVFNPFLLKPFLSFRWHLKFIKSEFRGQLPKPYDSGENSTSIIPSHMNDMNREETSRYVSN